MKKIAVGMLVALSVAGAGTTALAKPSDAVLHRLYNLGVASGFTYTGNNETHTFGGHTVTLTTTAGSLQTAFDNGTGNLTVTIDGAVIYSGATMDFVDSDGQRVLDALQVASVRDRATTQVLRSEVQVLTRQLTARLGQAFAPQAGGKQVSMDRASGITGVSSGDAGRAIAVWGSASANLLNDYNAATKSDGLVSTAVLGGDVRMGDLVLGMAGTAENVDMDTTYNQGTYSQRGGSIGPYVAYSFLGGAVVADAFANWGRSRNHYEQPLGNTRVNASYMSERTIVGAHVAHNGQFGAWDHVERLGYSYTRQRSPDYVQSDDTPFSSSINRLGEWVASGRLGYSVGDFHPFGELSYIRDTMMTTTRVSSRASAAPANDKDEVGLALGLDYRLSDTVMAALQVSHGFFRESENNTSIVLDFRAQW